VRPTFAEIKEIVLFALYESAHSEDLKEYFTALEIKESAKLVVSGVMISRAANDLCREELVNWGSDPNDDSKTRLYSITDEGIHHVEKLQDPHGKAVLLLEEVEAQIVPASDRMVNLTHNQAAYQQVDEQLAEAKRLILGINVDEATQSGRDKIVASLEAAQRLWATGELTILQIRVGINMALERAKKFAKDTAQAIPVAVAADAINNALLRIISGGLS